MVWWKSQTVWQSWKCSSWLFNIYRLIDRWMGSCLRNLPLNWLQGLVCEGKLYFYFFEINFLCNFEVVESHSISPPPHSTNHTFEIMKNILNGSWCLFDWIKCECDFKMRIKHHKHTQRITLVMYTDRAPHRIHINVGIPMVRAIFRWPFNRLLFIDGFIFIFFYEKFK